MAKIYFRKIIGKIIENLRNRILPRKKISIDERILQSEGIEVLIQDERWIRLFDSIKKNASIVQVEDKIRVRLDEKTRLHMQNKINQAEKQVNQNRIAELTEKLKNIYIIEMADNKPDNEPDNVRDIAADNMPDNMPGENAKKSAKNEIDACSNKINEIDERCSLIEQRREELDSEIKQYNIALLDTAVIYLYRYMKTSRKRVNALDAQITSMRNGIKARIDERETLAASVNETYNFLHGLLGVKQIESIDNHFTLD